MNSVKVGLLTIGQSPREDITTEIGPLFLPHIDIVEAGLLDNLSPAEIGQLQPESGETLLVSRLRDGSQVRLSEPKISALLPEVIHSMKKKIRVQAVGLLCTHDFPETKSYPSVISPYNYLNFLITEMLQIQHLGAVVPLENQIEMTTKKWRMREIIVEAKSPYAEEKNWEEIAQRLTRENVEAVVLDCIGYKMEDRRELQRLISLPVLLPRVILAYAINQLF
ncbi:MAG: AroM family protein [Candidatus Aminicenantes bacterium]|nr:MAG: AroM family protein [Candidatus Aminicenantes bacterium]